MPRNDRLNKPASQRVGDETELAASVQIDYILDPLCTVPPSSPTRSKMKGVQDSIQITISPLKLRCLRKREART